jgi:hypothetical protein
MNKPYNIQNTNICNGIFHISFFKALLINEGETTRGERESGQNDPGQMGIGAKRLTGRNDPVSFLKMLSVFDVTIFSGRLFQYLTTLIANEYFLSCVLALWG